MEQVGVIIASAQMDVERIIGEVLTPEDAARVNIRYCNTAGELVLMLTELCSVVKLRFPVKTSRGLRILTSSEVLCCHMQGHQVLFALTDGSEILSVTTRIPFSESVAPLLRHGFLSVRRGTAVNPQYIESFSGGELRLQGNRIITVPRRMRASVMAAVLDNKVLV